MARPPHLAHPAGADQFLETVVPNLSPAGCNHFLSVLDAQRSLFAAQVSLVQTQVSVSTDLVALHKALGGGWDAFPMRAETATRPRVETVTASRQVGQ